MADERLPPIVLYLGCPDEAAACIGNNNERTMGLFGVRPIEILAYPGLWWAYHDPHELVKYLVAEKPDMTYNQLLEWVNTHEYRLYVRELVHKWVRAGMFEVQTPMKQRGKWRETVTYVVLGPEYANSPKILERVKWLLQGFLPNAQFLESDAKGEVLDLWSIDEMRRPADDTPLSEIVFYDEDVEQLTAAGLQTVGDLISRSETELKALGLDADLIDNVQTRLKKHFLRLAPELTKLQRRDLVQYALLEDYLADQPRILKALREALFTQVSGICNTPRQELENTKGIGPKAIQLLEERLAGDFLWLDMYANTIRLHSAFSIKATKKAASTSLGELPLAQQWVETAKKAGIETVGDLVKAGNFKLSETFINLRSRDFDQLLRTVACLPGVTLTVPNDETSTGVTAIGLGKAAKAARAAQSSVIPIADPDEIEDTLRRLGVEEESIAQALPVLSRTRRMGRREAG